MSVSPRLLRRRLRSVKSTGKIMKAMELVAASKMRRAIQLVMGGRPYVETMMHLAQRLLGTPNVPFTHPLLRRATMQEGVPKRLCVLVFASDRGLCGAFNTQVVRKALEFLRGYKTEELSVITIGSRVERAIRAEGYLIRAAFPAFSHMLSLEQVHPLSQYVRTLFTSGEVDGVYSIYTHYKSVLVQQTRSEMLLPIGDMGQTEDQVDRIEPSVEVVLDELLPRLVDAHIYQAALESAASEQSARMLAMRSANDAAKDMAEGLLLSLNQARQANITREISEISAGKAALM